MAVIQFADQRATHLAACDAAALDEIRENALDARKLGNLLANVREFPLRLLPRLPGNSIHRRA